VTEPTFDRAEFDRLTASIERRAKLLIDALDGELATTSSGPAPDRSPLTTETVGEEITVYREAIELTNQRIAKVEGEVARVVQTGPFALEERMRETLSQLRSERHGLAAELKALEALQARLQRSAS
jgi:hypothetical protein